jgi:hypothetical protein
LARETAILDFVEKLQMHRPDILLPNCAIPDECRISPMVLMALENVCERKGFDKPTFTDDLVMVKGRQKYECTIFAGKEEFRGIMLTMRAKNNL